MNLIYISNTRIPSEKANTYQSMVMCESYSRVFKNVDFLYPNMRNTKAMNKVLDPYSFYNIKNVFNLKKLFCIESKILNKLSNRWWFIIRSFSFAIAYTFHLITSDKNTIVITRDSLGLRFLYYMKRFGLVKQKIYFESHDYSKKTSNCSKYINGLIVINGYLKELYEKDGVSNILIAHDGVKLNEYIGLPKYQKKNKFFNIVYIGNLFQWKGVYTLIDCLEYFDENIKCTIVGGSDESLPAFREYVNKKSIKNIDIVGFVQKKKTITYIENADVLILPNSSKDKMSYYTSPLKLFEYMASKRPIVASNLPSLREILEDKKNAILFNPDDPIDLSNKIKWVLNNDCDKIAYSAYQDVQKYTWDKRAENILEWIINEK